MKDQNEKNISVNPISNLDPVFKTGVNIAVSAFAITNMISIVKLPIEKILQHLTHGKKNTLDFQSMRSLGLLVGIGTYVKSSMPRSCYVILTKNNSSGTKAKEFEIESVEPIEANQESVKQCTNSKKHSSHSEKFLTVPLFAAGETLFTHTPEQLTVLKQQHIEFNSKKIYNYYAMTKAGLGLRYSTSLLNLTCMTQIQQTYENRLFKNGEKSVISGLISGALSGVTAAIISHPLKQLTMHVAMSGRADDQKTFLTYEKTSTIFKNITHDLKKQTAKEIVKDALPKLALRSLQGALVFGITTSMNNVLGDTPAEAAYDKVSSYVSSKK